MHGLVEDVPNWRKDQRFLRRQSQRAIALGGLVAAGTFIALLCLVGFRPIVYNTRKDEELALTRPISTLTANAVDTDSSHDGVILLHPEQHVYRDLKKIRVDWNITKEMRSPDGVVKSIYLINGQFPGPTIEARSGDQVEVNVYNGIEQLGHPGVSIHWHGLTMKGANEMDGVVGLTQCAIEFNKSLTYRFRIPYDQAGITPILVPNEQMVCTEASLSTSQPGEVQKQIQLSIIMRKRSFFSLEIGIIEVATKFWTGFYNCSMAAKAHPIDCHFVDRPRLQLMDSNRVRLRVVNTGISTGFSIGVSDGSIKPIAVDGGNWLHKDTPRAKTIGLIHPGERLDAILDRGHPAGPTQMTIELDQENMPLVNFALEHIQSFPIIWSSGRISAGEAYDSSEQPVQEVFILADALGRDQPPDASFSRGPFQQAVLYSMMNIRSANHNQPVGSINRTSWMTPNSATTVMPLLSLDRNSWADAISQPTKAHSFDVPWFKVSGPDQWMELTLNNFDDKGHPFHLVSRFTPGPRDTGSHISKHGYEFYVMSRDQTGTFRGYNPFDDSSKAQAKKLNVVNPLRKDTVHVPAMGYVVLRFSLDNEGLWLLHCHVLWHQAVGMGMVIQVGNISEDVKQRSRCLC
ncbi:hypothetical protein E4U32_005572 [Claviceps aff. humidiphila group G2b]|nr:hypothetical protein E4U32_005572 [Claviceps aff. humidiphila group G2b]